MEEEILPIEEESYMNKQVVWIIVVVTALFAIVTIFLAGKDKAAPAEEIQVAREQKPQEEVWNDSFEVKDQEAGMVVVVQSLSLAKEGWLVVHELAADGSQGNALGAARIATNAAWAEVPLLRTTVAGNRYRVLIYSDDGDREFDLKKDRPRKDAAGAPISANFFALAVE